MEFDNSFEVPLPIDEAWKLLMDIRRIAPCLPGAELTEVVDDRTYKGKVGVRLGPVSLAFAGTVKFDEIDDAAHRAKISAQGSDAKGRGAANATATFHLEPVPAGAKVLVHTNLTLSGAVAQYGRGVGIIQVTAAQIITQFANNLKAQFAPAAAAPATQAAAASPVATPAPAAPAASALPGSPAPAAPQPAAPVKPISGFALAGAVLLAWLKRLFGRA
jgi:carbon monoxide dehydrogenase subunit G